MQHLLHLLSGYFSVKKCEGFEILPYLQVSKLAYHHFMDAGRNHETPEEKAKGSLFLAAIVVVKMWSFAMFPEPQFPPGCATRPSDICTCSGLY